MSAPLLHDRVKEAAEARPEATAIVHPEAQLTYGALERESNRLAWALRDAGCRKGDRVAFLLPRRPRTMTVVLGILKAGCTYVPLDVRSPGSRLARVTRICRPRVVVAGPETRSRLHELAGAGGLDGARLGWLGRDAPLDGSEAASPSGEAMHPDLRRPAFYLEDVESLPPIPPETSSGPDDAAYILFTSGSTGAPKGVVITHRNVTTFVDWAVRSFGMAAEDRVGGYTELTFDLSTFDLHATFTAGAELHLIPDELKLLPPKIVERMREAELTHWLSVPSLLEYVERFDVLRPNDLPAMKWVTWCGDVLPTQTLMYWMDRVPGASFANLYGPTETTVASSWHRVAERPADPEAPIPIGKACDGEEVLVLDEELRPLPQGEVGEIYIRGAGVSPGYWGDGAKTREVFLPDPFEGDPTARLYRTGDLGRVDERGDLQFLGREDEQVKTRGFRVELGEVEAALRTLPDLEACVVVGFVQNGTPGKLLGCAYVPTNGVQPRAQHLKRGATQRLPDYMVPVRWKCLDELPLNARGKVDRKRIQEWMEEEA